MYSSLDVSDLYHTPAANSGLRKWKAAGTLFLCDEAELYALDSEVQESRPVVKAERARRAAQLLAPYAPPAPVVHHKQAVPKLSTAEQQQLVDELHDALLAGVDAGESGPLIAFLEKQNANVHGSLVSWTVAQLATHCFNLRAKRRELDARVEALEATVKELQARESEPFPDKGIWNGLEAYAKNDCVTVKDSYWVCRAAHVSQRPGSAATAAYWRLAAKGGVGIVKGTAGAGAIDAADLARDLR